MKANIKLKQDGNYKIMTIEGEEEATDYVTTVNIPTKVMKMNIPLSCKLIAGFIFSFNFNNKKFFATNSFIANSLNISKHTVKESLSILEKNKVIFREYAKEKNKNDRSVYFNFNIMSQYEEKEKLNSVPSTESVPTPVQKMYHAPSTESVPHVLNNVTKQITKQTLLRNGSPKTFGNEDINFLINYLKEKLEIPSLDGSVRSNRNYCSNLIKRMKKSYPNREPRELICKLIDFAVKDKYHSTKVSSFSYLFNNYNKILLEAKRQVENPQMVQI